VARILVDTSVWIDHLRNKNTQLGSLLEHNQVLMHPLVRGELACGYLHNRVQILSLLSDLAHVPEVTHEEALYCLEAHSLMGKGIGLVDVHLLSSVFLSKNTLLWTRDKRLHELSKSLNIGMDSEY